MFQHGYWIPARNLLAGDRVLALQAQAFYRETLGLDSKWANVYDGVSIYSRPDGSLVIRAVLQNFFTDRLDVQVHDYPYIPPEPDTVKDLEPVVEDTFQPFVCGECGAQVEMLPSKDNFIIMRQANGQVYQSAIPPSILVPRCEYCETVYMGHSTATHIAKQMGGTLP